MEKINYQEISNGRFGKCLKLYNEKIELVIALEFGIRILFYGLRGRQNILCNAPDVKFPVNGREWSLYGGHRLWVSPETSRTTYYPDDQPVNYRVDGNAVEVTQPLDEWANVQKEMVITIQGTKVHLLHRITNKNSWPIELSAWAVTVMAAGGTEIIPFSAEDTGYLHNRQISIWPYTDMGDRRVTWLKDFIVLEQDSSAKEPFKIGIDNKNGWAAYVLNNEVFFKRFPYSEKEVYPDNNVSYETYTCNFMTEMESLSAIRKIACEESIEHTEEWDIFMLKEAFDFSNNAQIKECFSNII